MDGYLRVKRGAVTILNDLPIEIPDLQPGDEVSKEVIPHSEAASERSIARRAALQALYEIDSAGHEIGTVLNEQMKNYDPPLSRPIMNYMRRLVIGVAQHRQQIDAMLRTYAIEFPLAQIAIIDRTVLRIAVLEFVIMENTPIGVAIDEAVELAKLFGSEASPRFVNGVLGSLADDKEALDKFTAELAEKLQTTDELDDE
jgi:N utilization substance protein B